MNSGKQYACYNTFSKLSNTSVFSCYNHPYTDIPLPFSFTVPKENCLFSKGTLNDCTHTCIAAGYNKCIYNDESHSLTCL